MVNFYAYEYFLKQVNSSQNFKFVIAAIIGLLLVGLAFQFAHHHCSTMRNTLVRNSIY